jgi:hypothetical protein
VKSQESTSGGAEELWGSSNAGNADTFSIRLRRGQVAVRGARCSRGRRRLAESPLLHQPDRHLPCPSRPNRSGVPRRPLGDRFRSPNPLRAEAGPVPSRLPRRLLLRRHSDRMAGRRRLNSVRTASVLCATPAAPSSILVHHSARRAVRGRRFSQPATPGQHRGCRRARCAAATTGQGPSG